MEETSDVSKKSIAIKYGMISGLIGIIFFVIQDLAGLAGNQDYGWVGLVFSVVISGVIIYFAHNDYKKNGDQHMNYGEGLGIGTLLSLFSGILSGVFTYVYVSFINTSFIENIKEQQLIAMEEQGMSDAQIEQAMKISENFTGPVAMAIYGIIGAVVVGFLVSLVVSAITKKSRAEFE